MTRKMNIYFDENLLIPIRVEIDFSRILAFSALKTHFKQLSDYSEMSKPGIYFLWGRTGPDGEYTGKSYVYIGKTKDLMRRTREHAVEDWWDHIIAFTSVDGSISDSLAGYLERTIYDELNTANQVITQKGEESQEKQGRRKTHTPPGSPLTEMDKKVIEPFKADIYQILGVLGHPGIGLKTVEDFYLKDDEIEANLEYYPGAFTVKRDSKIRKFDPKSVEDKNALKWVAGLQAEYFMNGLIKTDEEGNNILLHHITFSTASAASQFVLGRPDNGRTTWLYKHDNRNWSEFVGDFDL